MLKQKYTGGATHVSAPLGDTSRAPVSVPLPQVDSVGLPPNAAQFMGAGMSINANANAPAATQATDSLAMFNASAGYTDTGASSTGDLGGAA
jgi:hypothetical protein